MVKKDPVDGLSRERQVGNQPWSEWFSCPVPLAKLQGRLLEAQG